MLTLKLPELTKPDDFIRFSFLGLALSKSGWGLGCLQAPLKCQVWLTVPSTAPDTLAASAPLSWGPAGCAREQEP